MNKYTVSAEVKGTAASEGLNKTDEKPDFWTCQLKLTPCLKMNEIEHEDRQEICLWGLAMQTARQKEGLQQ